MKDTRKIAVWMDHSKAKFVSMEPLNEHVQTMHSEHDIRPREDGQGSDRTKWAQFSSGNEYNKNKKEIEQLRNFYSQLAGLLEEYDDILLLGPTNAKKELFNLLGENKKFQGKEVSVENSEEMSDRQLIALVKKYFEEKEQERVF